MLSRLNNNKLSKKKSFLALQIIEKLSNLGEVDVGEEVVVLAALDVVIGQHHLPSHRPSAFFQPLADFFTDLHMKVTKLELALFTTEC
jgi:hypothetical protein